MKLKTLCGACLVALLSQVPAANAAVFTVFGQLTGDPRALNPDNLVVDVTIEVNGDTAKWTVNLNSPLHPDMKLDVFTFNLLAPETYYSFSDFSPTNWAITTDADNVPSSGSANFMFLANDPPPGPPQEVNNAVPLTFTMKYSDGVAGTDELTLNHFLGAADSCSSNEILGCGQMGAHLQSLTQVAGDGTNTNSGFAFGNYEEDEDTGAEVPEPASLALLGLGLAGLGLMRRRRA